MACLPLLSRDRGWFQDMAASLTRFLAASRFLGGCLLVRLGLQRHGVLNGGWC